MGVVGGFGWAVVYLASAALASCILLRVRFSLGRTLGRIARVITVLLSSLADESQPAIFTHRWESLWMRGKWKANISPSKQSRILIEISMQTQM